jgi:DNA polymerase III sliding clamp (beta) subunit (PCNA family)
MIDRLILREMCAAAAPFSPKQGGSFPILSTFRITAEPDKITLRATDIDTAFEISAPVNPQITPDNFDLCIEASKLRGIVEKLWGDEIEIIQSGEGHVVISDGTGARFEFPVMAVDDFPAVFSAAETEADDKVPVTKFALTGKAVYSLFAGVLPVVPTKDPCKVLMGVLLTGKDAVASRVGMDTKRWEYVSAMATDGKSLLCRFAPCAGASQLPDMIIPRAVATQIVALAEGGGDINFTLCRNGRRLIIETASDQFSVRIFASLIEGQYPNVDMVIPKPSAVISFDLPTLQTAIGQAEVATDERTSSVSVSIAPDKEEQGELSVSAASNYEGLYDGKFPITAQGEKVAAVFHCKFLQRILNTLPAQSVTWKFHSAHMPHVFTCEGVEGFALLMPIRTTESQTKE